MDRRSTLLAIGGALPLLLTSRALRAAAPDTVPKATPITPDVAKQETLQLGTLAKLTSVVALQRSGNTLVRTFAESEIQEQDAVATSLTGLAKPHQAPLSSAQLAKLRALQATPDSTFDSVYLYNQILGHEGLLQIQLNLLADGLPLTDDAVHIALLSKAFIQFHLVTLRALYATHQ